MTTGNPQNFNIQVQVNNEASISTLKTIRGKSVAIALVPGDNSWKAQDIRDELIKSIEI